MHSADCAITRCLSICHMKVFCHNGYTYPQTRVRVRTETVTVCCYMACEMRAMVTTTSCSYCTLNLSWLPILQFREMIIRTALSTTVLSPTVVHNGMHTQSQMTDASGMSSTLRFLSFSVSDNQCTVHPVTEQTACTAQLVLAHMKGQK